MCYFLSKTLTKKYHSKIGRLGQNTNIYKCENNRLQFTGLYFAVSGISTRICVLHSGKYVASFGDGPGRYKQLLLETGKLKGYDAYDGAPYSEITSEGRVKFMDLAIPQFGLPVYDWVNSLEVAEHIPREYEGTFLDNIVRHAKEGVILSWSSVNAGYGHVNKRPFEYVVKVMDDLGFKFDKDETEKLKGGASKKWLQRNVNVYKRKDLDESIEKFMFNHA